MNECKVESIRGKDIQRKIMFRSWFDWSVRSVQSFTWNGKMNKSTITQVVFERSYFYPHRAELEPLELQADKLKFPNPKPPLKSFIVMTIIALIFGGLYLAVPYLITLLVPLIDLNPQLGLIQWIVLGIAGFFALWVLPLLITAVARKIILSKNKKKMEKLKASILKIVSSVPSVANSAPAPVVRPTPVAQPTELPKMPKVEKPLVRPLIKPVITPVASQPAAPTPTPPQNVSEPKNVTPSETAPEKPIE